MIEELVRRLSALERKVDRLLMPELSSGGGGGLVYVDRGDPDTFDFTVDNLTLDNSWYSLDLSGIVTDPDAVLVHVMFAIEGDPEEQAFWLRKLDNSNDINVLVQMTQGVELFITCDGPVVLSEDQVIEYRGSASLTTVLLVVRGWWKPA